MKLDEILQKAGKYRPRKRLGRGIGSGQGKTAGRGTKGAGSRSGWKQRIGHEGGQTPFYARFPKRGFSNFRFTKEYQIVNVSDLEEKFSDGAVIDAKALHEAKLIRDAGSPVKILGDGALSKKLTVKADRFTISAAKKIADAGGKVEGQITVPPPPKPTKEELEAARAAKKKPQGGGKEKSDKAPKGEKGEKPAKAEKGDKGAKAEKPDGGEKPGKQPKTENEPKPGAEGSEKPKKEHKAQKDDDAAKK
ncbi:MAG: 50S ribosomal protein L15 [Planctomycetes bacterium]|nr:50S ribosomal protein L15 [Planctomycetota bacterium]